MHSRTGRCGWITSFLRSFSGRRSGVRRVAHAPGMVPGFGVGVLVWKRSLASRVLGGRRGAVWVCFWVPGPPPATWSRAVFRMPLAGRRRPCGPRVGSGRGAWWFENWIVDASNAMM